jgi:tetratricopeptide (TPR) repeat protein
LKDTKGQDAVNVKKGDAILLDLEGRRCEGVEPPRSSEGRIEDDDGEKKGVFQKAKSWLVIVGEKDLVEGLDIGLVSRELQVTTEVYIDLCLTCRTHLLYVPRWFYIKANMKDGQTAYIYCHSDFALRKGTRKFEECEIAPNTNVIYKATVLQIVQDTSRLNPYFSIQKALTRKKIANDLYQYELLNLTPVEAAADDEKNTNGEARDRALKLYRQAGRDMKDLLDGTYFAQVELDHPQRKECRQLMIDSYNNVTVVYMHAKQYTKALDAAEIAMKRDPKNLKAMVRHAKLQVILANSEKNLKEAADAIRVAEKAICYKDKAEEAELQKIRAQYKKRQQRILGQ